MDDASSDLVADRWAPRHRPTAGRTPWIVAAVIAALAAVGGGVAWSQGWRPFAKAPAGPAPEARDYKDGALRCVAARDMACAETNWSEYVRRRPTDSNAVANLAIVLNLRDKHELAVTQFQRAIDAGEGTYDLFSYYADSLAKLGRVDEAIDWNYRALSVVPNLVDVRGSLAKQLVQRHRPHEALALLQAYDANAEAKGQPAYFTGQRISIENRIRDGGVGLEAALAPAPASLRLPTYGGHFYAPVTVGVARPQAFIVDTGATRMAVSRDLLAASKVTYRTTEPLTMVTADGRRQVVQGIVLSSLRVGPFELKDVPAALCDHCLPLLGQTVLSRFDLQSSRVQGVEFLTMAPRGGVVPAKGR